MKRLFLAVLYYTLFQGVLYSQDVQQMLFQEVENLLSQANSLNAVLLSPENYASGLEEYNEAKTSLKEGESLADIREIVSESRRYLEKAVNIADMAQKTFVDLLKAREDSKAVSADIEAKEEWENAEEMFKTTMDDFENGDVQDAKEASREAEKFYRQAELISIKNKYLGQARELIRQGEESELSEYAPITFAKAQLLLQQAESDLTDKRYDNKHALNLVNQSVYETRHAMYIDKYIRELIAAEKTWEDIILGSEKPLETLANQFGLKVKFDAGYDDARNKITGFVKEKDNVYSEIVKEKNDLEKELSLAELKVDSLLQVYTAQSEELEVMVRKLEEFEKEKREFQSVVDLFGFSEAEVYKDGGNVVVSLTSLNFDAGKAIIDPQYFALLSKVQKAITLFNDCTVSIEGHTDSQGTEEQNLSLSQERADAVRQYLLANIDISSSKLLSIGYGESKPIANNETEEGRRKNRRIDVVMNPAD